MTSEQFCFWLHGFFELGSVEPRQPNLSIEQIHIIKKHLDSVFNPVIIQQQRQSTDDYLTEYDRIRNMPIC